MTRHPRKCTARSKRTGSPCEAWAIHGGSVCVRHGGQAGQVRAKANERLAQERASRALAVLGVAREVDPHAALLEEVHRTAGHVAALELIVGDLERDRLIGGVTRTVQDPEGKRTVTVQVAYSIWYRLYVGERKHLLDACRTAVACGVEQKRVELEERQGAMIAQVLRSVFEDPALGLDAAQRRAAMVTGAQHLRLIAA